MNEPLITIGITCYKEGDWLLECWQSVLAQTDDRWVAILVMDGGADQRTRDIFEQLDHPKLKKCALSDNQGPYPTRNKAFELTETPYHFYLDGVDQLLPDSVALVLEVFEKQPDAGFVYGDYQCFGNRSEIWEYPRKVTWNDLVEAQPTPGPCAYTKQLWEHLGGYAVELSRGNADYDFLIGSAESKIRGYHCGHLFYRYRLGHAVRVSNSYRLRYHETHELMVRRHPRFFERKRHRNRFLALGYYQAAEANYAAGNIKKSWTLAFSALRYGMWTEHRVWSLVLRLLLPSRGFRASVLSGGLAKNVVSD